MLDAETVSDFADATHGYLVDVCAYLGIDLKRIAIDAPSAPRPEHTDRRTAEVAMDRAGISCFATPSAGDFEDILAKVRQHLADGGAENRIPHANQLWMLVGFELFRRLAALAPCIEVFPQATARVLGSGQVHKIRAGGVESQLRTAAVHTGWPSADGDDVDFGQVAFGPSHDRLDAYLAGWVAALDEKDRLAFGTPPDDVIWTPRVHAKEFEGPSTASTSESRTQPGSSVGRREGGPKVMCPGCGKHEFQRWPFGWDSHAAHTCEGLFSSDPDQRKREFKSRFASAFRGNR